MSCSLYMPPASLQGTAEGHEFNFIMIQQVSDIQSCVNVFLAPKNLGIDIRRKKIVVSGNPTDPSFYPRP